MKILCGAFCVYTREGGNSIRMDKMFYTVGFKSFPVLKNLGA